MEGSYSSTTAVTKKSKNSEASVKGRRFLSDIPVDFKNFALALLSGLLIYLAWPNHAVPFLLFFALIPLLLSLVNVSVHGRKRAAFMAFFMVASAMLTWSLLSVFWLSGVALKMYLLAVFLQSVKVALPFVLFPWIFRKSGLKGGMLYFATVFVSLEYVSQHSLLASPYFMLGYGLSEYPLFIQIYRYLGIEGGTVWVLIANVSVFYILYMKTYKNWTRMGLAITSVIFPAIVSLLLSTIPFSSGDVSKVVIHHSGRDPHMESAFTDPVKRADELFEASFASLSNESQLVIWPESVLIQLGWLHGLDQEAVVLHLKERLEDYPRTTLVFGGIGFSEAMRGEKQSRYTRYEKDADGGYYYNTHNVTVSVRADRRVLMRSKEHFIPFQERVPYLDEFPLLEHTVESVGLNTMFSSYSRNNSFFVDQRGHHYLPVLCYESIFPVFTADLCKEDVGAVIVLANEYWMPGNYGAMQYFHTAIPLAIQSGKPVLRSSNGGISAIVDAHGNIVQQLEGKQDGNIQATVHLDAATAPYSFISGYSYLLAAIVLLLLVIYTLFNTNTKTQTK